MPAAVYPVLLTGVLLAGAQTARPQSAPERQVKAAFLYNFAKFVEWPPQTFASSSDPFVLCAYGKNPVADALKQGVEGKTVQNRTISVKIVKTLSDAEACQVLY
ncbi:MAG: YfiR family protein, partial [Terriglobia bacterium]